MDDPPEDEINASGRSIADDLTARFARRQRNGGAVLPIAKAGTKPREPIGTGCINPLVQLNGPDRRYRE